MIYSLGDSGPVVLEVVSNASLDNRAVTAHEIMSHHAFFYLSDGTYVAARTGIQVLVDLGFCCGFDGLPTFPASEVDTTTSPWIVPAFPSGPTDSITGVIDLEQDHGLTIKYGRPWQSYPDSDFVWVYSHNALTDTVPTCPGLRGGSCFGTPVPPFNTTNTSGLGPPQGLVTFRVYSASADTAQVSLSLSADATELHPWIREFTQAADNGTIEQGQRIGDTTTVTFEASVSGAPVNGLDVTFTAELVERTGGHHHLDDPLLFSDAPPVQAGDAFGRPVTGYFKQGGVRVAELSETTDSNGEATFAFVAGFVSGDVRVIATTEYGGETVTDTLELRIVVPGLIDMEDESTVDDYSYLIGQTVVPGSSPPDTVHARDSIWHVTPAFADALELLTEAMRRDSASVTYHLQVNDASLPFGGSFSVVPFETETEQLIERAYFRGHRTHALGVDVDIGWCQVESSGEDGQADRISGTDCSGNDGVGVDYELLLPAANSQGLVLLRETDGLPHYHLRLPEGS